MFADTNRPASAHDIELVRDRLDYIQSHTGMLLRVHEELTWTRARQDEHGRSLAGINFLLTVLVVLAITALVHFW